MPSFGDKTGDKNLLWPCPEWLNPECFLMGPESRQMDSNPRSRVKDGEKAKASATVGIFFRDGQHPGSARDPASLWMVLDPTPEVRARKPQCKLASVYFAKKIIPRELGTLSAHCRTRPNANRKSSRANLAGAQC